MKIFSRARCRLRPPTGKYTARGPLGTASIHHGGEVGAPRRRFATARATWQSFQTWHQNGNGWIDIGYHFGIDALGRLYEGRPVQALPAAVGGHNTGSISFVFLQDGDRHKLTWLQRRTLQQLFEKGIPSRGVPPLRTLQVLGHQEFTGHSSNACPGAHIIRHLKWRRGRYAR